MGIRIIEMYEFTVSSALVAFDVQVERIISHYAPDLDLSLHPIPLTFMLTTILLTDISHLLY